jgi:hypothetical protein
VFGFIIYAEAVKMLSQENRCKREYEKHEIAVKFPPWGSS